MAPFNFIHAVLAVLRELDGEEKQMISVLLRMQLEKEVKREEESDKCRALHHLQYSICQGLWNMLFADRMPPWTGEEPEGSEWVTKGDGRVRASFYTLQRACEMAPQNWHWAGMMINQNYVGPEPRVTWDLKVPDHLEIVPVAESAQVGDRGSSSAVRFAIRQKVVAAKPEPAVPEPKGPGEVKAEVAAAADVQRDVKGKAAERPKVEKAKVETAEVKKAKDSPPADPPKVIPSKQKSSGAEGTKTGASARQDSQGKATEKAGVVKGDAVSAAVVPPTKLVWVDEEPTGVPPPSVQDAKAMPTPRVTSVPGVDGVERATVVQPATTKFGLWQDPQGKDLPCFAGVGPGEVVLPVNMDPNEHIYPARPTVEALLNVKLWYEPAAPACPHKRLRILPARETALTEAKAMCGNRAFWVLAQWTLTMDRKGIMISLLDFVRNFVRSEASAMAGRISSDMAYITGREIHSKPIKAIKLSGEQKQPQPQEKGKGKQKQQKQSQPWNDPAEWDKAFKSLRDQTPQLREYNPPVLAVMMWEKAAKTVASEEFKTSPSARVMAEKIWEKVSSVTDPRATSELIQNAAFFVKYLALSFAFVAVRSEMADLEESIEKDWENRRLQQEGPKTTLPRQKTQDILKGDRVEKA